MNLFEIITLIGSFISFTGYVLFQMKKISLRLLTLFMTICSILTIIGSIGIWNVGTLFGQIPWLVANIYFLIPRKKRNNDNI